MNLHMGIDADIKLGKQLKKRSKQKNNKGP